MVDEKFTLQKDDIIAKAKDLDREAKNFKNLQTETVAEVANDIETAKKNQIQRKKKDEELERERKKNQDT